MCSVILSNVMNLSLYVVMELIAIHRSLPWFQTIVVYMHSPSDTQPSLHMPTHTFEPFCVSPFVPDAVCYMKCVPFTCVGLYGVLLYPSQVSVPTCSGKSSAHWVSGFGVSGPADTTGNNIAHWRHSRPCYTHI